MNNNWKQYKRKGLSEMIPYKDYINPRGCFLSELVNKVQLLSISEEDKMLSTEELNQGYVARNPKNHGDLWYVAKKYFDENLEEV